MKPIILAFAVHCFCLVSTFAETVADEYIKSAYETEENFKAVLSAEKVTVCLLTLPPLDTNKPGPRPSGPQDYLTGTEKELPANLVSRLRETLSFAAGMYDPEEELPAGVPYSVIRYTFHTQTSKIFLDFSDKMGLLTTSVDGKIVGGLWLNRPAILPLRAISKRMFPDAAKL